jgi:hypothetical protein
MEKWGDRHPLSSRLFHLLSSVDIVAASSSREGGREGGSSFHRYRKRLGTERFDAFVAFLTIDRLRNREGLPPPGSKHQLIIIIIISSVSISNVSIILNQFLLK